ncbi:MFS domain-containing protein [Fusarium keratoplasticum]|uniref:MFS domain-containing protein n=1 Tax=Fusarium keratoplasticum TaxID=1328300 RepID=A0ACC0QX85_9HYPO|nr:MFS domain-containing protein [Fusarium keratoplasticum]KAI8669579.1 MFS domain-containing protein [Fusarium keratoplasticum]KAI8674176.1 MFS domain-containing protein [Fusarium keratoplasticum]
MATEKQGGAPELQIETTDNGLDHLKDVDLHDKALNTEAHQATAQEHSFGVFQALKTYKRAAFWSILISTTVIMEGYDVTLLSSFYAYPTFREKYGAWLDEDNGYQISANWQQRFNCLGAFANIIGALLNGWATAKWGHRKVLMASLFWLTAFIFVVFFAPNIEVLLVGQFLCNIPWGVFATTGPAYAAEVTPLAIRGYLTAYVNLCWCIGQFISAGVLKGLVSNSTEWSYRVPFAIQWVWPVPLFIAAWMAPESPWYLVRTNQLDEAKRSLERLSEPEHDINIDATVAMMVHTNKLEIEERAGVTYWDCFRGSNIRRTEIACVGFLSQITNGGALCYSGSFFFQQTGISPDASYGIALGGTGIAFVGTIISWFYISKWGRRTIWLAGFSSLVVILWVIGFLALAKQTMALAWAQSLLCIVWLAAYSMSVGPIIYTLVAEIGSTRLRTQTVVLARSTYYVGNIVCGGLLQPQLLSPGAWNAKGKTAFFWAGLATLTLVWGYFRMFETKGRTFGEMDYMFQKGVPARKSANYKINEDEVFLAEAQASREQK